MADNSAIEWTNATWNPIRARNKATGKVGWHCEHATTGCEFCYAEGFNKRLGTGLPFKPGHRQDIDIFLDEKMLTQPLRWKKPRTIFVCSMTDLFAEFVPDEWIDKVFAVMALCPQHTFQVLTKRAKRMRDYFAADEKGNRPHWYCIDNHVDMLCHDTGRGRFEVPSWPLPNVWLGVSTERQQEADERIPELLKTPAAVRFISAEPLLGPIDLLQIPGGGVLKMATTAIGAMTNTGWHQVGLHWVIVGGESGRESRAMHPDWARSLRDQCSAAGVCFFFKQWGEWAPSTPEAARGNPRSGWRCLAGHPHVAKAAELYPEAGAAFVEHMGKKAAGRHLDGKLHDAMPEIAR